MLWTPVWFPRDTEKRKWEREQEKKKIPYSTWEGIGEVEEGMGSYLGERGYEGIRCWKRYVPASLTLSSQSFRLLFRYPTDKGTTGRRMKKYPPLPNTVGVSYMGSKGMTPLLKGLNIAKKREQGLSVTLKAWNKMWGFQVPCLEVPVSSYVSLVKVLTAIHDSACGIKGILTSLLGSIHCCCNCKFLLLIWNPMLGCVNGMKR